MKNVLLVASTLFFMSGAAYASSVDGVVANYNASVRVITLDNGKSYSVPRDVAVPPLQPGVKVQIDMNDEGDRVTTVLTY